MVHYLLLKRMRVGRLLIETQLCQHSFFINLRPGGCVKDHLVESNL